MVGLRGQSEVVGMVAVLGGRERVDLREEHATGHNLGAILMLAPTGTIKFFFALIPNEAIKAGRPPVEADVFSSFYLCANCLAAL